MYVEFMVGLGDTCNISIDDRCGGRRGRVNTLIFGTGEWYYLCLTCQDSVVGVVPGLLNGLAATHNAVVT